MNKHREDEPLISAENNVRGGLRDRAFRYVGIVLLAVVILQALVRLALIFQQTGGSINTAVMHGALVSGALVAVLSLLALTRERSAARFAVSLLAASVILGLTTYDLVTFVTRRAINKDLPLATISEFYCGNEGMLACPQFHPGAAAAVALVLLALAALIWAGSGRLVAGARQLVRAVLRVELRTALAAALAGSILAAAVTAGRARADWVSTEPMTKFFTGKAPNPGPGALLRGVRNDAPIVRSATLTPRPIILIIADALRSDAITLTPGQPSNTPFLQSLVQTGKLHDLGPATAVCDMSYCGITAIHGSADWATLEQGRPTMLADVLAANGFQSHFLLSGQHRNALNLKFIYGPNYTTFLDDSAPDAAGSADDRDQIRRLATLKLADPSRSFIAFHLMSTHNAALLGEQSDLAGLKVLLASTKNDPVRYADVYRQRVRQLDSRLKALFAVLQQRGLLQDALIVLTADHGERLNERYGQLGHGYGIDPDTGRIPVLIYDARNATWPRAPNVSQIDIAPTLLAAIGARAPATWRGQPLQRPFVRSGAPIDTIDRAAVMIQTRAGGALVRCGLAKGKIDVLRFGAASAASDQTLIAQATALRSGMTQRPDAQRCFRQ